MLAELANSLSSPLVHAPLFFALIRSVAFISKQQKLINRLSYMPLVWLMLCSMTYPSVLLIKPLEDQYPIVKIDSPAWQQTDAIVVLACNYFEEDELPFVSKWPNCSLQRNLQAVMMYRAHAMPIYLAGDILGSHDSQAQAIHNKSFFISLGVDPTDIFTIEKGTNTQTEVAALASMLQDKKISLVTSASHLPRAMTYFQRLNIETLAIPVEHLSRKKIEFTLDLPNAASLYRSERAIHEYLGIIYQKVFL